MMQLHELSKYTPIHRLLSDWQQTMDGSVLSVSG